MAQINAPTTMGAVERMLHKGEGNLTDADIFGGEDPTADPLAPKKDKKLDYLGHFANDNVTTEGHNSGHKPKGKAVDTRVAKAGYLKLPDPSDRRFDGADYAADARSIPPQSQKDLRISAKHHRDSIAHETRHERDHRRGKAQADKMGDYASAGYHKQHLTKHAENRQHHENAIADMTKKMRVRKGSK